ncbi:hypothetical protein QYM36_014314 [Artemia franciscana]|uniref:Serum response factor-binding protein 1 n=2 Tax=Artemia franciscana TaxID=6661 RepID=A0AA88HC37_ARTSF|nr:hypothetical protein QYM36_014314 [Artemia franciscana]
MRKDVNRARLWVINKVSKTLPKWRSRKGADAGKYHRRAERLVEELQVMKKVHPDLVSKFALCSKLTPSELEKQMQFMPTEQRALARLSAHKFVQSKVTLFYECYNVKKERVLMLVKALGVRYSKKKGKNENKTNSDNQINNISIEKMIPKIKLTSQKNLAKINASEKDINFRKGNKNENKWDASEAYDRSSGEEAVEAGLFVCKPPSETSYSDAENSGDSEGYDSNSNEETVEAGRYVRRPPSEASYSAAEDSEYSDAEGSSKQNDNIASGSDESNADFQSKLEILKDSVKAKPTKKKKKKNDKRNVDWKSLLSKDSVIERSEGALTVKRLHLDKVNSDTIDDLVSKKNEEPSKRENHVPTDAFFLGGNVDNDIEAPTPGKKIITNRFNSDRRNSKKLDSNFVTLGGRNDSKHMNFRDKSEEVKSEKFRKIEKPVAVQVEENLHPSWAAKRKQKEIMINSFEGKKIRFDDE